MANSVNEEKPKKGGKKVAFTEMILPLVDTTDYKRKNDKKKAKKKGKYGLLKGA